MVNDPGIESILVADCGKVITKVLLLERVEDSYRFVAQSEALTTMHFPWNDVGVGVIQAIEDIELITGRILYQNGRLLTPRDGQEGVDAFVVILSAPEPLHIVLAGLVPEMSLESARRAAAGTYTKIDAVFYREGSLQFPQQTWARTIRDVAPDVVLLVGGIDGGAMNPVLELADAIALGASMLEESQRPVLLYAGNALLRERIAKMLGKIVQVEVVDNVRPTSDKEHLGPAQETLERLYIERRLKSTPGVDTLSSWSRLPLQPAASSLGRVVEYLWHRERNPQRGSLGIDVGAASTSVAAVFDSRLFLSVQSQGIAFGPASWVEANGMESITRWLPEEFEEQEIKSLLLNRQLRPWTVPQELRELWVEQAVVREMLRDALRTALPTWSAGEAELHPGMMPYLDPILICGGGIVHMPRPGQALLTVLDGLQPVGISTVFLDFSRAASALGAVASIKPLAAASAMEAGTLIPLGTIISPVGRAKEGDVILKMRIVYEDGSSLDVEAHYGELEIWPLLPGQQATLEIKPHRRFDIGLGGAGKGGKVHAIGGRVGLVVDARGRPLELPEDPDECRARLNRWIWDVGG
ncbi:MAG: glutamate mutase L [Anaerolineae bacterium]|nr:glutamate mutase L [Anaerolineae bacterium]